MAWTRVVIMAERITITIEISRAGGNDYKVSFNSRPALPLLTVAELLRATAARLEEGGFESLKIKPMTDDEPPDGSAG